MKISSLIIAGILGIALYSQGAIIVIDEGLDNTGIPSTISSSLFEGKAINFVMAAGDDYTLTDVVLGFGDVDGNETASVQIWSDDGGNAPLGSLLETLTLSGSLVNGQNTFTSAGLTLNAGATYWVTVNAGNANTFSWLGNNVDTSVSSDIGATHTGRRYAAGEANPGLWENASSVLNQIQVNAILESETSNAEIQSASVSGTYQLYVAEKAFDGEISDASRWIGEQDLEGNFWIELHLAEKQRIGGVHVHTGYGDSAAIEDFYFDFKNDAGAWVSIPSAVIVGNTSTALRLPFDATVAVETDTLRLVVTKTNDDLARIKEVVVWPYTGQAIPPIAPEDGNSTPLIYLNQTGFNLNKPKQFSAPTLPNGTPFQVFNARTGTIEFEGSISDNRGDFSSFNPDSLDEFFIVAGGEQSFPFQMGHWWLERVTYESSVRFMVDSRHYFGNVKEKCKGSFGWRDDHHFNWVLTTLLPQYLSNPSAYERMPKLITYEQRNGFNGALEPFSEYAPDIVKMMHHFADVTITQGLKHELMKEQLAYFLYAWPWIGQYFPEQNYQVVSDYAFGCWTEDTKDRDYPYDTTVGHNLLALKTQIGTTKGENPPGHSVQPNLMMYEVALRDNRSDAELYFQAAYDQVAWMIENLDWDDPQTTKGQRMSEHITMSGLAMMLTQYPERAPEGLKEKIEAWTQVMVSRSGNMWDFRKLSDVQWTPTGDKPTHWNEPGNVLGFPAIALAAINAVPDNAHNDRLLELAYAHLDNAFGRNPTGRHFSYDAPSEIEGCDLGWYSFYPGGIGQLADTPFVFDGAPKNEHYPYNPEVGDIGWTEGWVQFNTAFNISLAYMAYHDTQLSVVREGDLFEVRLKAPLNFDYSSTEQATVQVRINGLVSNLLLHEEGPNSEWFSADLPYSESIDEISYGYGYMSRRYVINQEEPPNQQVYVNDTDPSVSYLGAWSTRSGNLGYNSDEHTSETAGSEASFTFTGNKVWFYGFKRNDLGHAELLIDDESVVTVDCYAASPQYFTELYESEELEYGEHTLTVRVTDTNNPSSSGSEVIIDAFGYIVSDRVTGWEIFVHDHSLSGTLNTDEDQDGSSDFIEYAIGGDVRDENVNAKKPRLRLDPGSISFSHMQRTNVNAGVSYFAEWTNDLLNDPWINEWDSIKATPSSNEGYDEVEHLLCSPSDKSLFFRLRIEP